MGHLRSSIVGLVALLGCACGLIDDDDERRSAADWCGEGGDADVAEVELYQRLYGGTLVNRRVRLRDENGNVVVEAEWPTDDRPAWREESTVDASGRVIEVRTDVGLDGVIDRVESRSYDENGRPTQVTIDRGNDGTPDWIAIWDYSTASQLRLLFDTDGDGETDRSETSTYEGSLVVLLEYDDGNDGTIERRSTSTISDDGRVVEHTTVDTVIPLTETITFEHGEDGRLLRAVQTRNGGESSFVTEESHEYGADGQRVRTIRVEEDSLGTKVIEITYDYDDAGRTIRTSTLDPGHSAPEIEQHTYDEEGRLLRTEVIDPTGALSTAEEYEYAEGNTPIRTSLDTDGDGTWEQVTTRASCD